MRGATRRRRLLVRVLLGPDVDALLLQLGDDPERARFRRARVFPPNPVLLEHLPGFISRDAIAVGGGGAEVGIVVGGAAVRVRARAADGDPTRRAHETRQRRVLVLVRFRFGLGIGVVRARGGSLRSRVAHHPRKSGVLVLILVRFRFGCRSLGRVVVHVKATHARRDVVGGRVVGGRVVVRFGIVVRFGVVVVLLVHGGADQFLVRHHLLLELEHGGFVLLGLLVILPLLLRLEPFLAHRAK